VEVRAQHLSRAFYQERQSHILSRLACPNGGTGRRAGLKIRLGQPSEGSIPFSGTSFIHSNYSHLARINSEESKTVDARLKAFL
jgi:hypothetical protein